MVRSNWLVRPGMMSPLLDERRHPEVVDDVGRGQHEAHGPVDRHPQGRQLRRRPGVVGLVVQVVERPAPAVADHVDVRVGLARHRGQLRLVAGREEEQHPDDDHRHSRVEQLDRDVVAGLDRHVLVALAIGDDRPEQQADDQGTDHEGGDPGPLPQPDDPIALHRRGGGHAQTRQVVGVAGAERQGRRRQGCTTTDPARPPAGRRPHVSAVHSGAHVPPLRCWSRVW